MTESHELRVLTVSLLIFANWACVGVPMILMMCRSWSLLSLPLKSGTPEIISAKMQPQDHTSMDVLYVREPRRTSGARYHRVTTRGDVRQSSRAEILSSVAHLVRESVHRDTKRPRQTEVTQLELALAIDEQVLWLEISMEDLVLVTKGGPLEELVHEAANCVGW